MSEAWGRDPAGSVQGTGAELRVRQPQPTMPERAGAPYRGCLGGPWVPGTVGLGTSSPWDLPLGLAPCGDPHLGSSTRGGDRRLAGDRAPCGEPPLGGLTDQSAPGRQHQGRGGGLSQPLAACGGGGGARAVGVAPAGRWLVAEQATVSRPASHCIFLSHVSGCLSRNDRRARPVWIGQPCLPGCKSLLT